VAKSKKRDEEQPSDLGPRHAIAPTPTVVVADKPKALSQREGWSRLAPGCEKCARSTKRVGECQARYYRTGAGCRFFWPRS